MIDGTDDETISAVPIWIIRNREDSELMVNGDGDDHNDEGEC